MSFQSTIFCIGTAISKTNPSALKCNKMILIVFVKDLLISEKIIVGIGNNNNRNWKGYVPEKKTHS